MYNYLQSKPQVGIISGFSSGIILSVQNFLTDEKVLKIVAGAAAWLGLLVAFLTALAWTIKMYDLLKARFKK